MIDAAVTALATGRNLAASTTLMSSGQRWHSVGHEFARKWTGNPHDPEIRT